MLFVVLTACLKEDYNDCGVTVEFMYNHNILSTNVFENYVDQVNLYVFSDDGIMVQQHTNGSIPLTNNFKMRLDYLDYSNYHFAAWAQSTHIANNQSFFTIPNLTVGVSSIDELIYTLKRNSGIQQHELNNLLVGTTEAVVFNDKTYLPVTVNLMKVTNKIRVEILSHISGDTIDVANYNFFIIDEAGNGRINYDYIVLPDEKTTYLPHYATNLLLPDKTNNAAVVEMSTSRLMVVNTPRLKMIDNNEGKEIVSMNLPYIFSLTNMENNTQWSLQEYLDRQDRYTITLYFHNNKWISSTIIINGWAINNNELEY